MNSSDFGRHNTVFLRLEGPLQSWGDTSKFVIRRSMEAPTKSGVLGLVCCAMGLSRQSARDYLRELNALAMGVRIDRPGTRWWDYHTVGAGVGMTTASGGLKTGAQGTLITRREYLADASFFVALQGDAALIRKVGDALATPKWTLYLGRKSCTPSLPVFTQPREDNGTTWTNPMVVEGDVKAALQQVPWCPRYKDEAPGSASINLPCLIEWRNADDNDIAPGDAEVWYDAPFSFDPPVCHPRLVTREQATVKIGSAIQNRTPAPPRPRANYSNSEYKKRRAARLESDHGLCVFCKSPATTVQHTTYRRAGGNEAQDDLRSLCRLCHDAVTMIEYGLGMGLDRIDPCQPRWRDDILRTRSEIVRFRSEEGRRRALRNAPEKVRKEVLEEDV
jgi:CRISPR-associated protein Cas5/CasD subtype I-E